MASKVDDLKNDFLTCPLCLQLYKNPKLLLCQHTFCLKCLEEYARHNYFPRGKCVCPYCKQTVPVPEDGDLSNLPNNFLVVGLLQFASGPTSSSSNEDSDLTKSLPSHSPGNQCPLCEVRVNLHSTGNRINYTIIRPIRLLST